MMIRFYHLEGRRFHAETILLIEKVYLNFLVMTHNIEHISKLPPLYEVERGLGGEYTKAKMKRCDERLTSKGEPVPLLAGGNVLDIYS